MGQKWLLWACMGEKSFTMAPNTSRRGDLSFKLLVLTCPVRDKIRPASVGCAVSVNIFAQHAEKGPKSAFFDVLGEFCTGHAAAGVVWGEFCTGRAARELRRASFVPMGTWGRGAGGPCGLVWFCGPGVLRVVGCYWWCCAHWRAYWLGESQPSALWGCSSL